MLLVRPRHYPEIMFAPNLTLDLSRPEAVPYFLWDDPMTVAQLKERLATAPEIEVTVAPQVLWPPNHKMVEVEYTVTVSDICDDDPQWELVNVVSNEPQNDNGDGNTEPDIQDADLGTPDTSVSLRAERDGRKTGRVYTATFEVTDCSGNATETTSNVYVPHSKNDIAFLVSSGSGTTGGGEAMYMLSGASLWGDAAPVEAIGGAGGEVRFVEPLSALITNTAGYVAPSAYYIKDADFDGYNDVLMAFDRSELFDLRAVSDELDGEPVLALEIGPERFIILEMTEILETDLDLGGLIDDLREGADDAEVVVTQREDVGVPRAAGIFGVAPNPFNPKTSVSFYVPEGGHVNVAVYDISGRMVTRLLDSSLAAGEHSVEWNGVDKRGSRVASGVYFFRMRAGAVVDVQRGILVK